MTPEILVSIAEFEISSNLLNDMDAISTHAVLTYLSAYSSCSV